MDSKEFTYDNVKTNPPLLKLTPKNERERASNLTLKDLNKLILFKFGSFSELAKILHITRQRVYQIFKGLDVPKTAKHIKHIAEVLEIDPVVLSQVFNNASNRELNKKSCDDDRDI